MAFNGQYQSDDGDLDVPEQPLEQDYDAPSAPPESPQDQQDATHPQTDTNIDPGELYEEGLDGAAEIHTQEVGPADGTEEEERLDGEPR
jgi:hypothetical protein